MQNTQFYQRSAIVYLCLLLFVLASLRCWIFYTFLSLPRHTQRAHNVMIKLKLYYTARSVTCFWLKVFGFFVTNISAAVFYYEMWPLLKLMPSLPSYCELWHRFTRLFRFSFTLTHFHFFLLHLHSSFSSISANGLELESLCANSLVEIFCTLWQFADLRTFVEINILHEHWIRLTHTHTMDG